MIYEMIASQILFWGITIFSAMIWWQVYRSEGGRMKTLALHLFATKVWVYGLAGVYYLLFDFGYFHNTAGLWIRIWCNAPMVFVMFEWYRYIKYKK